MRRAYTGLESIVDGGEFMSAFSTWYAEDDWTEADQVRPEPVVNLQRRGFLQRHLDEAVVAKALSLVLSPAPVAAQAQAMVLVSMAIRGLAMETLVSVLVRMEGPLLVIQALYPNLVRVVSEAGEKVVIVGIDVRTSTWLWVEGTSRISWMIV